VRVGGARRCAGIGNIHLKFTSVLLSKSKEGMGTFADGSHKILYNAFVEKEIDISTNQLKTFIFCLTTLISFLYGRNAMRMGTMKCISIG
jgi:hypothetical protein